MGKVEQEKECVRPQGRIEPRHQEQFEGFIA
jgi:hypothetical protein